MMLGGGTWWAGDGVGDTDCGCGRGCGRGDMEEELGVWLNFELPMRPSHNNLVPK